MCGRSASVTAASRLAIRPSTIVSMRLTKKLATLLTCAGSPPFSNERGEAIHVRVAPPLRSGRRRRAG